MTTPTAPPHRLDLPADLTGVAAAQTMVEAACADAGLAPGRAFKLSMAVDELLTNVATHGAAAVTGAPLRMAAAVWREDGALVIELSDDGPAFDPFRDAREPALDAALDDRPIGGLGVHLVRTMVDRVSYARRDGRNVVTLTMGL